jgi:hypothetical protein
VGGEGCEAVGGEGCAVVGGEQKWLWLWLLLCVCVVCEYGANSTENDDNHVWGVSAHVWLGVHVRYVCGFG